ncbi:MAG: homoserine O-acetyltransferase MetX, partial [Nostoc sp.]
KQPALVVGIDSDILYPTIKQEELADLIPHAQLGLLKSIYGHDAFLIDTEALNKLLINFIENIKKGIFYSDYGG